MKRLSVRDFVVAAVSGAIVSVVLLLLWPSKYESTSVLLLDSPRDVAGALDLGAISDLIPAGLLGGGGGRESGYSYLQVCESYSLLSRVLDVPDPHDSQRVLLARFGGLRSREASRREDGVEALRKIITTTYDPKANTFRVTARARTPELSAVVANAVVAELRRFDQVVRTTRARDALLFVKARLDESKAGLGEAEARLAAFQEANARIGNSPRLHLAKKRLERDVVQAEEVYALLAKQLEIAQIQEKKESPVFSTVDPAIPPTKPARLSPLLVAASSAAFCGVGALLLGISLVRSGATQRE